MTHRRNRRTTLAAAAFTALLTSLGCGKKHYGAGCEKAASLTTPWSDMALPIDAGTRICASSSKQLKLRSYDWLSEKEAQDAIGAAVVAAGYTKDKCDEHACHYDGDGYRVSVQPMDFGMKKKKLQTVVVRRRKHASARR